MEILFAERTFQKKGMVDSKYLLSNVDWAETTGFWKKELVSWQEQFG